MVNEKASLYVSYKTPAVQAYFGRAKAACLCSYCCNRHLCYDGGSLGTVKIVTLMVGARAKEGKRGGGGKRLGLGSNFYTGIRTRFACSAKTLPHFYLISECCLFQYVFFLWRVDYAMESSMFWLSKCDFSRLFNTERSWHAYWFPVVFEFLIGMICPLMQKHFLWPLSKRKALSCGSARLWGPLFLSKVSQDLNN